MRFLVFSAFILLGACSHPLEIAGKGDIRSLSGERDCTFQQFSSHVEPSSAACPNYVVDDYQETYTAIPFPGWKFIGWTGCESDSNQCVFDIPASVVNQFWGGVSTPLVANFESTHIFQRLPFLVIDAAYIESRDLLVMIGEDRNIHLYDPETRETISLNIERTPNALSISPDGTRAVVGHDGYVTLVDLENTIILQGYEMPVNVFDLSVGQNDDAYIIPANNIQDRAWKLDLESGSISIAGSVFNRSKITRHPSNNFLYFTSPPGISPHIWKADISSGDADFFQHRSFNFTTLCEHLWNSDDGLRLFTACGKVLLSSDEPALDLTLVSELAIPDSSRVKHLSQKGNEVLFFDSKNPEVVRVHDYSTMEFVADIPLPTVSIDNQEYLTTGDFIFHQSNSSPIAIAEISSPFTTGGPSINDPNSPPPMDPNSPVPPDPNSPPEEESSEFQAPELNYGLVLRDSGDTSPNVRPSALVSARQFVDIGDRVELDGSASFDPEGSDIQYQWDLISKPSASTAEVISPSARVSAFEPDTEGAYLLSLSVNDGELSQSRQFQIEAENLSSAHIQELDFIPLDAAYTATLDKLVMITGLPDRAVIFDLSLTALTEIPLAEPATNVEISQDGLYAAIWKEGDTHFTIVDLATNTPEVSYSTSIPLKQVLIANNGYAYAIHDDSDRDYVHSIRLSDGLQSTSSRVAESGSEFVLHASGDYMYGSKYSGMTIWDISSGTAQWHGNDPYGYWTGLPRALSEDLMRVVTDYGLLFRTTPGIEHDMQYAGDLDLEAGIVSASITRTEVAILMDANEYSFSDPLLDTFIAIYDLETLNLIRNIPLPPFKVDDSEYVAHGRQVFYDSSGDTQLVLMQADESSGLSFDYALFIRP